MKKQRIVMSAVQFDRLMSEVLALPAEPIGRHLSGEELVRYALENSATGDQRKIMDLHLRSCSYCLAEAERIMETSDDPHWDSRAERRRDASAPPPESGPQRITLLPDLALPGPRAGVRMSALKDRTPGGMLRWRLVEDDSKNLIVRFRSNDATLSGTHLTLSAGDWRYELTMAEVESDQVGARAVITRKDREQMRAGTPLRLDLFLGICNSVEPEPD